MNAKKTLKAVVSLGLSAMLCLSSVSTAFANTNSRLDANVKYRADYASLTELEDAAAELNIQLESEGAVLLKNDANALPLAEGVKVTVLGTLADTMYTGGAGSGGQTKPAGDNTPDAPMTLFEGLDAAGIEYNPSVKAEYEKPELNPKTLTYSGNAYDGGHYMDKVDETAEGAVAFDDSWYAPITDGSGSLDAASLEGYTDAAIVVISRSGAEGQDNDAYALTDAVTGEAVTDNVDDHYMQLTSSEKELMAYAKANFDKVVVIINSPSAMELGCLENDEQIDAVLWVGLPGWNGVIAIGRILNGEVNPSGRTVDFFMADFATDPTWYNFGDASQAAAIMNNEVTATGAAPAMGYDAAYMLDDVSDGGYKFIDYAEGIYLGYRYYETVYAVLAEEDQAAADEWYAAAAVYPFGYGLSYTSFDQELVSLDGDLSDAEGTITAVVKVTNTGAAAGKEVVQLYAAGEYVEDEIEKAACNLVGFGKTQLLQPGQSEEVTVTFAVKDLASFDYNDANGNDFCGYELEAGDYTITVRRNSHEIIAEEIMTASEDLTWDEDGNEETPNAMLSAEQDDEVWGRYNTQSTPWVVDGEDNYLRRSQMVVDGVVALEEEYEPGSPNAMQEQLAWALADGGANNLFTEEAFHVLNIQEVYGTSYYDHDDPITLEWETDVENAWLIEAVPEDWTQFAAETNELGMYPIELTDMIGVPLDDPMWTEFMNQMTWDELTQVANDGGYGSVAIQSIGKPDIECHDGPGQMRQQWCTMPDGNGYAWACEVVIGSTWNTELALAQGHIMGNESLLLNVTGWYGPGTNIHRSPLSGRNFEYYSQDGVHAGKILASVVKGATEYGVHVFMKHGFLNDQETSRNGVCTFANEQAIRQIYVKPFEIAIKEGDANGIMTSFNRIGLNGSASYPLTIGMYENEFGYDGISITDAYYIGSGWTPENLVRGHVMPLNFKAGVFPPLQRAEGVWDQTLRDGKGGILVAAGAGDSETVESATEYYWVRTTAMRALYTYANSNAMTGLKATMIPAQHYVHITAGESTEGLTVYEQTELDTLKADMDSVYGEDNYNMIVSGGPEGMTFDWASNSVSGTAPAVPGGYDYTVTIQGKGNMSGVTCQTVVSVCVDAAVDAANVDLTVGGLIVAVEGENYIANGDPTDRNNEGKYTSVECTAEGLPEGLTLDTVNGGITGSFAGESGTHYPVTITQTAVLCQDAFLGFVFNGKTIVTVVTFDLIAQ